MNKNKAVLSIFADYIPAVEVEIKKLINSRPHLLMYDMMRYFFGFLDDNLEPANIYAGKRYRAGLCLLIADLYNRKNQALEVATAIEVFHNFTLIHDDIEDNDSLRRGRETIWKKWGINHGINTGDAQSILVNVELNKLTQRDPILGARVVDFINDCFLQVIEGQFLDFTLTDLPINDVFVNQKKYMEMITKKTSVMVGAATKSAGMVVGVNKEEKERLWQFGLNLGLAFQIRDDWNSIWATAEQTGKQQLGDIYEQKKTLPIFYAYDNLTEENKNKLVDLYGKDIELNTQEVEEIIKLLNQVGAKEYLESVIAYYTKKAKKAVNNLSVSVSGKQLLIDIIDALVE